MKTIIENARKYFEANLLDGDNILTSGRGQMIRADDCWNVVEEIVKQAVEEIKERLTVKKMFDDPRTINEYEMGFNRAVRDYEELKKNI